MTDVNDLLIRIDATTETLRRELKRAEQSTDETSKRIDRSLSRVDGRFDAMSAAARKAQIAIAAVVSGALARRVFDTAKEFELLRAQLQTVEGGARAAALAFDEVQAFATSTPFQLQEVVEAYIQLKNRGLDPSADAMRDIGNMAASMGRSLRDTVQAFAQATVGEMESLKSFGIVARQEGERVRFTFKGVTTEVAKNQQAIQDYLLSLSRENFAGGMERQMDTLVGAMSNLGDATSKLIERFASESGLTAAMKAAALGITEFFNALSGQRRAVADIEADIARVQARIVAVGVAGTQAARKQSRGGTSTSTLQRQLADLREELQETLIAGSGLEDVDRGIAQIQRRIQDLRADIARRQEAGESESVGSGRASRVTELGRALSELAQQERLLAEATQRRQDIQSRADSSAQAAELESASVAAARLVATLQEQAATLGFTTRQLKLYELAQAGANEAQIRTAESALDLVEAFEAQVRAEQQAMEMFRQIDAERRDARKTALDEAKSFFERTRTDVEVIEAQIARVQELAAEGFFREAGVNDAEILARLNEQLEAVKAKADDSSSEIARSIATNVGGAFDEMFTSGTVSAQNFFDSVLRDIARVAARILILKPLIEGLFGAGGGAGGFGQALFKSFGFARGGEFVVGGSGGPDSQFFPMRLSPGEHVKITPPGKGVAGSAPIINVHDNRGAGEPPIGVRASTRNGQHMIDVIVEGAVARMFQTGAIDRQFAASGMPIRRGGSR